MENDDFQKPSHDEHSDKYDGSEYVEKFYTTKCDAKSLRCGPVTLFYNPNIKQVGSSYFKLANISSADEHLPIEKVDFEYVTGEPGFIAFLAGLKTGSFIIATLFLGLYSWRLSKIP
jgi:hypothetical protein